VVFNVALGLLLVSFPTRSQSKIVEEPKINGQRNLLVVVNRAFSATTTEKISNNNPRNHNQAR
jgi:hypothetical protein